VSLPAQTLLGFTRDHTVDSAFTATAAKQKHLGLIVFQGASYQGPDGRLTVQVAELNGMAFNRTAYLTGETSSLTSQGLTASAYTSATTSGAPGDMVCGTVSQAGKTVGGQCLWHDSNTVGDITYAGTKNTANVSRAVRARVEHLPG